MGSEVRRARRDGRRTDRMSKNLNDAAMAGNLKEVEMRLNMGEDVNQTQFPRYTTALHDATACGRTEVARLLIKRGADVNAEDYKGCTPLRLARRYGQEEIEMMLEAKDAKDEQEGPSRKTSEGVDPPWMSASRRQSRREEVGVGAK